MIRDIRFGFRLLTRSPLFAAAALTVVALGGGATTTVFPAARGVLLRGLPYQEPDRLVIFRATLPGYEHHPLLTPSELFALRDRGDLFEAVAAINESRA